jgi:hypothetical protein
VEKLRSFPLPKADETVASVLINLVKAITLAKTKNHDADTSALEREIDQHVYALYGLTPEEIAIVEGAGK